MELISGAGGHEHYSSNQNDPRLVWDEDDEFGALRLDLRPGLRALPLRRTRAARTLHRGRVRCRPAALSRPLLDDRQLFAAEARARRPWPASAPPAARGESRRRCRARGGAAPGRPARRDPRRRAGTPTSACTRSSSCSGILPSSGAPISSASSWPPPSPKIVWRLPSGRREAGHVLDHAEDLEVELGRHLGRAVGNLLRGGLRSRHQQDLGLRQQLGKRHRDVAGPRRQVDQQVVELAPVDVLEELLDRLVQHRPAPHDGCVLLDEEADRHHLHARRRNRSAGSCAARRPAACPARRACAACCSPRRLRRARPPSGPRAPAPRRGSRSPSTCRRRPSRTRRRSRCGPWPARPAAGGCGRASAGAGPSRRSLRTSNATPRRSRPRSPRPAA